ncbi:MAG: choice-of-anchor Q domain-containing protein [Akkermansiaceae bacterium]
MSPTFTLLGGSDDLLPLGFYGDSTEAIPPRAGSPVIDAGETNDKEFDQRGLPRPHGAKPDLGAVEYQGETS